MLTIENLTLFFGWSSVINIALLTLSTFIIMIFRTRITSIHSQLFKVDEKDLPLIYIRYLGNYKIAIIIFNIVPYIALKLI